jgi:hypothetical protein
MDGKIIFYETPQGKTRLEVTFEDETFWLTQKRMAELFEVEIPTINYHLKEIFESKELDENSVIRKIRITALDGKAYLTNLYSLDAIIAVGYRVNSRSATLFRIWATGVLKEYLTKGFVLDSERLKLNSRFGKDYFDELLEKIREIRASERRFYLKVTDIFEQCSNDYDSNSKLAQEFFATIQNKLHYAITKHTAAELINERANIDKPNMGLMTHKNAPKGKILKSDVTIAKNYLTQDELKGLERLVSMYLDYAEDQASRGIANTMSDWVDKTTSFLIFNEFPLLEGKGTISKKQAQEKAENLYSSFRIEQDKAFVSDFERATKTIKGGKND